MAAQETDPLLMSDNNPTVNPTDRTRTRTRNRIPFNKISRLSYSPRSHVQVLFQMHGSVLPQVLPFCLSNVLWTLIVEGCRYKGWFDLTFKSTVGHSFMGILVSFLVVARSRISYQRFMDSRRHLGEAYLACRELIHSSVFYTLDVATAQAKEWRQEVAFRTIVLLRVTMDVLYWSSTHKDQWETVSQLGNTEDHPSQHIRTLNSFRHGTRTLIDEHFRAPLIFIFHLREMIMKHPEYLGKKLAVNEYRDILRSVSDFNKAFHGFRDIVFVPYPFPLAQMTRIFLFCWVYSLPLVLLEQMANIYDTLLIVFFMTFGFIGVESVSITLDDAFGDNIVNFDVEGFSETVNEDIYFALYKMDGPDAATKLHGRVMARYAQGKALENYQKDLLDDHFWGQV